MGQWVVEWLDIPNAKTCIMTMQMAVAGRGPASNSVMWKTVLALPCLELVYNVVKESIASRKEVLEHEAAMQELDTTRPAGHQASVQMSLWNQRSNKFNESLVLDFFCKSLFLVWYLFWYPGYRKITVKLHCLPWLYYSCLTRGCVICNLTCFDLRNYT